MMEALWIPVTLAAAAAQTARNATQRGLTDRLGVAAAAQVRFLFGLPFALAIYGAILWAYGEAIPTLSFEALGFGALGAGAQVAAMMVQLDGMRRHDFAIVTAMAKTEPAMVALLSVLFLGEHVRALAWIGIALATLGVVALSLARGRASLRTNSLALGLGLLAGLGFALSAVWMRASLLAVDQGSTLVKAGTIMVLFLTLQAGTLLAYFALADRKTLVAIAAAWRPSLSAGALGALATLGWSLALALASAAYVRTLGLVEVLMAQIVGRRLFAEVPLPVESLGMALIVIGAGLVVFAGL